MEFWDIRVSSNECHSKDGKYCGDHRRIFGNNGIPHINCEAFNCPKSIQYNRFVEWFEHDLIQQVLKKGFDESQIDKKKVNEVSIEKTNSLIEYLSDGQKKMKIYDMNAVNIKP